MLGLTLLSFVLSGVHVLLLLFVFLFTYTGVQRDGHGIVCPFIYGFWLPLCSLQTFHMDMFGQFGLATGHWRPLLTTGIKDDIVIR